MNADATHVTPKFKPLTRPPHVSSSIARQILGQIEHGALPLGARLPSEEVLAREFGVSRPTIREALAALQFAGYVESRRGFGTTVLSVDVAGTAGARLPLETLTEAVDLLETRLLIEPQALAAAAMDPDRSALVAARELIGGMHLAVDEPGLHASTDIRVHRALLMVCRNKFLRDSAMDLVDLCVDPLLMTARTQAWTSSELPHVWADQHEVVCEAIAAGNPQLAKTGSYAHLASVVENLAVATMDEPGLRGRVDALLAQISVVEADNRRPGTRRNDGEGPTS